jgi:ABC-type transport system involved in multi-copper enzyme maturation permease subunit
MITLEIFQSLIRNKWRWLITAGILFVVSFFIKLSLNYNIAKQMEASLTDFIVEGLNQQFLVIIVLPMLFLFLITDTLLRDIENGYVSLLFTRAHSRFSWLIAKLVSLFIYANLFTLLCLVIYFIDGLLLGLPFSEVWAHQLLQAEGQVQISPVMIILSSYILHVLGLTSLGMLVIFFSLLFNSTIIAMGLGAILSIFSYIAWMDWRGIVKWMITSQMLLSSHFPYSPDPTFTTLTIYWSFGYFLFLFAISFLLTYFWFIRMNLAKRKQQS